MHTPYLPTGENNRPNEEDDIRSYSSWTANDSQFTRAIEHHLGDLDEEIIQYIIEVNDYSCTDDENTTQSSDQDEKSETDNSTEATIWESEETATCESESNSHRMPYEANQIKQEEPIIKSKELKIVTLNTAGNFDISIALQQMFTKSLDILAIQEPFPWGKKTSDDVHCWMIRVCADLQVTAQMTDLQVILTDKAIIALHRKCHIEEKGRLIINTFEIDDHQEVHIASVYGIPHGTSTRDKQATLDRNGEQKQLKNAITDFVKEAKISSRGKNNPIFIQGDLQDTPDNSAPTFTLEIADSKDNKMA
jgi:hypothetical protein